MAQAQQRRIATLVWQLMAALHESQLPAALVMVALDSGHYIDVPILLS